jgi:hypothetical protein
MPNLVAMKTDDGEILVEAEFSQAKLEEIGVTDDAFERIEGSFKSIAKTIKKCSTDLADTFNEQCSISKSMKSAEIEFGVKVSAEGNVYVAKTSGEANITVKLNWEFNQKG